MTSRKSASLHRQTTRSSGATRRGVAIEGRCSIGGREPQTVLVTDLGETGCRMKANAVGVIKSDTLELWLGDSAPIAGRLKWTRDGALGVAFESPLAAELLDGLYEVSEQSKVVPLRR
jgi:hypothetical protein